MLGVALARAGREQQALHAYRRAVRVEPRLATAYANLGQLHARRGEAAEAVQHPDPFLASPTSKKHLLSV